MLKKQWAGLVLWGAILFVAWNALLLLFFWTRPAPGPPAPGAPALDGDPASLTEELIRLAQEAEQELEQQRRLLRQIHEHQARPQPRRCPCPPPARRPPPPCCPCW